MRRRALKLKRAAFSHKVAESELRQGVVALGRQRLEPRHRDAHELQEGRLHVLAPRSQHHHLREDGQCGQGNCVGAAGMISDARLAVPRRPPKLTCSALGPCAAPPPSSSGAPAAPPSSARPLPSGGSWPPAPPCCRCCCGAVDGSESAGAMWCSRSVRSSCRWSSPDATSKPCCWKPAKSCSAAWRMSSTRACACVVERACRGRPLEVTPDSAPCASLPPTHTKCTHQLTQLVKLRRGHVVLLRAAAAARRKAARRRQAPRRSRA